MNILTSWEARAVESSQFESKNLLWIGMLSVWPSMRRASSRASRMAARRSMAPLRRGTDGGGTAFDNAIGARGDGDHALLDFRRQSFQQVRLNILERLAGGLAQDALHG